MSSTRTDLDLAGRALGGAVRYANDDFFAPREALIFPGASLHDTSTFGPHGKIYDGWETRRRRTPGHDWAVVQLGATGTIHRVVVDTAHFKGNYPPEISVEATWVDGSPDEQTLQQAVWTTIVPRSAAAGDTANSYDTAGDRVYSHVRLNILPDGGVARLRVLGSAVADPRLLGARIDLAAIHHGGDISECSDMFYSDPRQVLYPGIARDMSQGWETARRRDGGNDYIVVSLAGPATVHHADIDTGYFLGNAPGEIRLSARSSPDQDWQEILPRSAVLPDAHNRFRLAGVEGVTEVRVDAFPDGGFSRLHLYGELSPAALTSAITRWLDLLPPEGAAQLLADNGIDVSGGSTPTEAQLLSLAW
ncbi:allantoicase [Nakamurella silvestris]|nr:allantoicase [Nakamurella silvestris]